MTIHFAIHSPIHLSISYSISTDLFIGKGVVLQLCKILVCLPQHPNWERKLEIWVGDRTGFIEYSLDRLLRPRAIL